jgi:DNA-binding XRE family transcriptional regulator
MSQMNITVANGVQFQLPLVASLSLYNDDGKINLRAIRKQIFRMTQEEMSSMLDVAYDTYKSWEKSHRSPSGPALSLLRIAVARPDVVKAVLGNKEELTTGAEMAEA